MDGAKIKFINNLLENGQNHVHNYDYKNPSHNEVAGEQRREEAMKETTETLLEEIRRNVRLTVRDGRDDLESHCYCREIQDPEQTPCRVCLEIRGLYEAEDALTALNS